MMEKIFAPEAQWPTSISSQLLTSDFQTFSLFRPIDRVRMLGQIWSKGLVSELVLLSRRDYKL
jgi:hypothetical protein